MVKNYNTQFYNLDAIIAVGYRVNSKSATQFRRWATEMLKEYIIKGFVLNDDMLKNGKPFGKAKGGVASKEILEHFKGEKDYINRLRKLVGYIESKSVPYCHINHCAFIRHIRLVIS